MKILLKQIEGKAVIRTKVALKNEHRRKGINYEIMELWKYGNASNRKIPFPIFEENSVTAESKRISKSG